MIELLRTKLFIPRPRKNLVSRPRLVDRLNTGLDRKLTLIAAPAGFGKTTLLSEWIPQSSRCVTWLSLDKDDNDPTKFWAYFISSLQGLRPQLGSSPLALLQSAQPPAIRSILTALLNDITVFPDEFSMVLDDYHVIEHQPIHEALAFFLDHLPANMHLIITTRSNPPLQLTRLRARDQLTEIRANDLRFSADEAAAFLSQVMGLSLSAEEVAVLEARTEGWIAGLQIAALSMQGRTFFGDRLGMVLMALSLAGILALMGHKRRDYFFTVGNMKAPASGMRLSWSIAGPLLALVLTALFTTVILAMNPLTAVMIADVIPLLPAVLLLALMNAFGEEMAYRAAPLSQLWQIVGKRQAVWLTALWFGLGHYYNGVSFGAMGVVYLTLVAVLFGKAMVETKGLAVPVFMHLWGDVVLYVFLALSSA